MALKLTHKPIKHRIEDWQQIQVLANDLKSERGAKVSLADAVAEAVKFYRENRPKNN